jgi:hypothetical protein
MDTIAWVEAAPFRAHVRHLCASAELPWEAVACQARVPAALVRHLLHGHQGRTLTKIAPRSAARLLAVTAHDLHELAFRTTQCQATSATLLALLRAGAAPTSLAGFCRLTTRQLLDLASARTGSCTERTALLARAAEARWVSVAMGGAA